MRNALALFVALSLSASWVLAADLKSGPQQGSLLAPFDVVKVAGAVNDGVPTGKQLCYRCKLGDQPVVMVFAPKGDAGVAALAKELDQLVAKNQAKQLGSFVNFVGDEAGKLAVQGKEFAAQNKLQNVAVVVPIDSQDGPEDYKINPQVVTVLIYRDGKVVANHALPPAALDNAAVKSILADAGKILN